MVSYNGQKYNTSDYNGTVLAQYVTLSEGVAMSTGQIKVDTVFVDVMERVDFSGKGLHETVKCLEWFDTEWRPSNQQNGGISRFGD